MRQEKENLSAPERALIQKMLDTQTEVLTPREEQVLRLLHSLGSNSVFIISADEVLSPLTMAAVLADFAACRRRHFLP